MSAGPSGSREFRTATPAPSGSSATSTQLPLGLLRRLFCHRSDPKRLVDEPFVGLSMRGLSMSQAMWGRLLLSPKQSSARASALAPARDGEDDIAQAVQFSQRFQGQRRPTRAE